jgi:hypothetical protein
LPKHLGVYPENLPAPLRQRGIFERQFKALHQLIWQVLRELRVLQVHLKPQGHCPEFERLDLRRRVLAR